MQPPPDLPRSTSGQYPLEVARACAEEARFIISEGFGKTSVSSVKGRRDVVTEVDFEVERTVLHILSREYPAHAVMSEETGAKVRSDDWMWVVDPLDGTKNFSRGIPHFCFSMALCWDSQPFVALTLQPLLREEFAAVRLQGAMLNGRGIRTAPTESLDDAVIALDLGFDDEQGARQLELATRLWPGFQALRVAGSAALGTAFVAAGRWDAFVHRSLKPWDLAAGLLLVREAGGVVTDLAGTPATIYSAGVLAAAPGVHAEMRAALVEPPASR
jgi:fructose-1,6-bisphosphatase/inositol monophosphatase family enzyme